MGRITPQAPPVTEGDRYFRGRWVQFEDCMSETRRATVWAALMIGAFILAFCM